MSLKILRMTNYMTVRIRTEGIRFRLSDDEKIKIKVPKREWMSANFRVKLPGLPCEHVSMIDPIIWKRKAIGRVGSSRYADASEVEISNLGLTISIVDLGPWMDWFNQFIINGEEEELDCIIEYLSPDFQTLASIQLSRVGILSLSRYHQWKQMRHRFPISRWSFTARSWD